jgi:hypothetical protein
LLRHSVQARCSVAWQRKAIANVPESAIRLARTINAGNGSVVARQELN